MTLEWVKRNHWVKKEMFELLMNPHLKILDLSKLVKCHDMHITDRVWIVLLASVRCSVKINSLFLYRSELMNNFFNYSNSLH
jgi:hypothetical protein